MTDVPIGFLDHLDELRSRVIKSLIALVIGTIKFLIDRKLALLSHRKFLTTNCIGLFSFTIAVNAASSTVAAGLVALQRENAEVKLKRLFINSPAR